MRFWNTSCGTQDGADPPHDFRPCLNQDFDTFTNVIDVYVNYLRNKIDRGRARKLIHTIRGSGYMLKVD